jgi:hypothetical protein
MANIKPFFEISDMSGSTAHANGTATTTPVAVPVVADKIIGDVLIVCTGEQDEDNRLQVSFDGNSVAPFFEMCPGDQISWTPKGSVKQIYLLTTSGTASYKMLVNFEEVS